MARASSRDRLPECGYTLDGLVCRAQGQHLCEPRADHAQKFFEEILVHTKGRFARRPFILASWQRQEILRPLFGTVRFEEQLATYARQYTLAWIELARKNGKSEFVAGAGLKLLLADDEEEAEVYGAAKDRDQAGVVFNVAARMVELSPVLSKMVERKRLEIVRSRRRIVDHKTGSYYEVIAADATGNLGWNPHGVLFDEVISQPNRELWDALKTGMGTRDQPLMLAATTAGNDPSSMAADEHLHSERVQQDPSVDPSRFVFLRNTPPDADWQDEATWSFANPALGDFLRIQVLRDEAREAASSLAKQNAFRQFRLNQWVRQVTRWLDMGVWDANAGIVVEEELESRECFAGLDLASTRDFTAWVLLFPGEETDEVLARFFLPRAAVERRSPMRDTLAEWEADGFLTVTDGEVLDEDAVWDQIDVDAQRFDILRVGYDRWNAAQLVRRLEEAGLDAVGIQQTTNALNGPSKELERRLGRERIRHGGNPVLRWMADNVQVFSDSAGNIKPDKKRSNEKIDGISALVDALWCELDGAAGEEFAMIVGDA